MSQAALTCHSIKLKTERHPKVANLEQIHNHKTRGNYTKQVLAIMIYGTIFRTRHIPLCTWSNFLKCSSQKHVAKHSIFQTYQPYPRTNKNLLELVLLPGNAPCLLKAGAPRYAGRNLWVGWGRDGWVLLDILFFKDVTVFYHPNVTSSITLAIVNPEPWGLFVKQPQLVTSIEQRHSPWFSAWTFSFGIYLHMAHDLWQHLHGKGQWDERIQTHPLL